MAQYFPDELADSFAAPLRFGTGGMRGPVGVGPGRVNPRTVEDAVAAHAAHLLANCATPKVVIAGDVRVFYDFCGYYRAAHPPLPPWSSADFAHLAASAYAARGVEVALVPTSGERYFSSSELSFAIPRLDASGGLYVSASHNPPDDNGLKFYDADGAQVAAPEDEAISARAPAPLSLVPGAVRPVPPDLHERYVRHLAARSLSAARIPLVFTALHGVGGFTVAEVLQRAGFEVHRHAAQCRPDGAFPTLPKRAPNPELPEVFAEAIAAADALGIDLVLASDPDADRLGVAYRDGGEWRYLSGQAAAVLLTHHVQRHRPGGWVLTTAVTTPWVGRVARAAGAQVEEDHPVGFKHLGRRIRGREQGFSIAVEESMGALISPEMRDKDAAGAALYLAEAAALAAAEGRTLGTALASLIPEGVGWASAPLPLPGRRGAAAIASMMASLRAEAPREIGGVAVLETRDLRVTTEQIEGSPGDRAVDQLGWELADGARLWIRPSGTEPRAKIYAEAPGADGTARAERHAQALARLALARAGLESVP